MKIFIIVFIAISGLWYTKAQCPPARLIKPCTCEGFLPLVQCGDITDMQVLVDVFERSRDRKFRMFALYNSSIQYLPATSITTKGFDNLLLVNVSMSALFDARPFAGNEINIIILQNVSFQRGIGWELFGPMKKLDLINAENTEIRSLGKSFTDNINRGLTNLIMKNTKTKKIQYNAFAQLTKLFDLEIVNSEIKSIQRSMFANPSALEEIHFSGNKLETLPDNIFSNMPVLKTVYLENNKITLISENVFGSVLDRAGWLYLEGNPLMCDCEIMWIVSKDKKRIFAHCAAPEDQKGKNIADMTEKDLDYCNH